MATATITLSLDTAELSALLDEIAATANRIGRERLPKQFLDSILSLSERLDEFCAIKLHPTAGAGEFTHLLEPSQSLLKLAAALRTLDRDLGTAVEGAGH